MFEHSAFIHFIWRVLCFWSRERLCGGRGRQAGRHNHGGCAAPLWSANLYIQGAAHGVSWPLEPGDARAL